MISPMANASNTSGPRLARPGDRPSHRCPISGATTLKFIAHRSASSRTSITIESLSVEPVATQRNAVDLDDVLQGTTVRFDRVDRTQIVDITGDQDASHTSSAGHDKTLAKNPRRNPASSMSGPNGIPDVATLLEQKLVECEPDRGTAHDLTLEYREQPCGLDPTITSATAVTMIVDHFHVLGKRLTRTHEGEHEVVRCKLMLGGEHVVLIADHRRSKPKDHPVIMINCAVRQQ